MTKVLVTGYGGFLGAEVARQLLEAGYQVRGLARGDYPELRALGVETMRGDVSDKASVFSAVEGCTAVINTAAKAGVWGTWDQYYLPNTQAVELLLLASQSHQVKAFVQTSSPSVTFEGKHQSGIDESVPYPQKWLCHYPHTKALAEARVLDESSDRMATCALRPHLIWGNGDPHLFPRVVERALTGRLRRVGSGKNLIDVVHVRNAARAHVQALQRLLDQDQSLGGQALFLTDGEPVECWEWITKILDCAEVSVPNRSMTFAKAYRIGAVLEVIYRMTGQKSEPPMTRFVAAQLALDHYFSIDRARKLLDYEPNVDREVEFEACRPWLRSLSGN